MVPEIEYAAEGSAWMPLPEWAKFVWHVGEAIAERPVDESLLVCVLSVPARDFVAATGTASYLSVRSAREQLAAPHLIPAGTDILVVHGGKGRIARVEEHGTTTIDRRTGKQVFPGLWIRLENGVKEMLGYRAGLKIARAPRMFAMTPGRLPSVKLPDQAALSAVLLHGEPHAYATSTSYDCLILGPPQELTRELEIPLRIRGTRVRGALGDIIRAQELLAAGSPWHTRLVSDRGQKPPVNGEKPGLVTFDGVAGLRRWRHLYRESDWLVILDRSRADYAEGVSLIENEHARRAGETKLPLPPIPQGIELSLFKVHA